MMRRTGIPLLMAACLAPLARSDEASAHRLAPVSPGQVTITDAFWGPKLRTWREVTIPDCFAKFEKDGALDNFDMIRDGRAGEHHGPPWYDGLIYEMIRGSADFLASERDPALEARLDGIVERIAAAAARDPDGYLNTWTQLKEPEHRWGRNGGNDTMQHDVYNAGALIEAAVHYDRATGKSQLLKVAVRLANYMCDVIGPPPRANVVPGHALAEEALVRLYTLFAEQPKLKEQMGVPVDERRYLELAEFFIENRGNHEGRGDFGSYGQDHLSGLKQETIEGHAVRATLMGAGITAIASATDRADYAQAARRLWTNMADRRMHITGAVGALREGEAFAGDYTLPNDGYLETCAAIGNVFFSRNLNLLDGDAHAVDVLERALYNGVLAGVSLPGNTYLYENPLECGPSRTRWSWHGCPCCPPMFLKVMGALPGYVYATDPSGLYVNLFIGSRLAATVGGTEVTLTQSTRYPWDGRIDLGLQMKEPAEFNLSIRVPSWCESAQSSDDLYSVSGLPSRGVVVKVNGEIVPAPDRARGYLTLHRQWKTGDTIELALDMPVRRVRANARVEADRGRVALMRGPLVYCLETADNPDGVRNFYLPADAALTVGEQPRLLGGIDVIQGTARGRFRATGDTVAEKPEPFAAIPYFANANRGPVEMAVWLPETAELAAPKAAPTLAIAARPSASYGNPTDTVEALNDQIHPRSSADESIPRFTWWDHRGTSEWVQYDFPAAHRVGAIEIYWWDERSIGRHCRVPQGWRVLYKSDDIWKPVANPSSYGTEIDRFNRVTFDPVETSALRIEVQLQPEWSGGILEWRVDSK